MIITTPACKHLETTHQIENIINGNRQSWTRGNHYVAQAFATGEPTQRNVIGAATNPHTTSIDALYV